jgi:hypothetical protein
MMAGFDWSIEIDFVSAGPASINEKPRAVSVEL